MKALVVYYTRTGFTKKVGEAIAKELKCDSEEIVDTVNRKGVFGYIMAGRDAGARKLTKLKPQKKDPGQYDLVVIGTPVWAWNMSAPVRTYLDKNKNKLKKVAYFCTQGGSGAQRTFEEMQQLCGKKPASTMELTTKQVAGGKFADDVAKFVKSLKK